MSLRKLFNFLLSVVFLTGCGHDLPSLEGIDMLQWKDDRNGCKGDRAKVIDILSSQKNKLQGLSELEIVQTLGRPDTQELYKRHQKFYYYFLEKGPGCGGAGTPKRLSVRFNATGASKEIAVE